MKKTLHGTWLGLSLVLLAAGSAGAESLEAISRPSGDVTLAFVRPGRVLKFFVNEGDTVTVGQALVQQDDSEERAKMLQSKAEADELLHIEAAKADMAQKLSDLKKVQTAYDYKKSATEFELEHARLDVQIAELSVKLAVFQHEQKAHEYEQTRLMVEHMTIKSPLNGFFEQRFIREGESTEQQAKVLRVVQIDPLWVEIPAPMALVRGLKVGDKARVEFPDKIVGEGRILHVAAVGDAASDTRLVRLEVPNAARRPGGEHVKVEFAPVSPR